MAEELLDSKRGATDEQMAAEGSTTHNLMVIPNLSSLKLNAESKCLLDHAQTEEERRQKYRARQRCIRVNKVRHMYSLGVSNEAAMQRIMEKHGGTLDRWLEEPYMNNSKILANAVERAGHEGEKQKNPFGTVEQRIHAVGTRPTLEEDQSVGSEVTTHLTQNRLPFSGKIDSSNPDLMTANTSTERTKMVLKGDTEARQPCCFADVLNTCKVIEPRRAKLLWHNYIE